MPAGNRITIQDILEHTWFKKMEEGAELPQLPASRLKNFNSIHKVKKVIFKYLSTELGVSRIGELRNWFIRMDTCGDGILSVEEIRKGVNDFSQKELEPWIEVLDITGEGLIEYDSNLVLILVFIAIALWKVTNEFNSRLREGFQVFDKDGDGKIDSNEMKEVVGKELGETYIEFWNALLKEADKNGDGKIDFY
jgi:calcium-dependent protein kinase